MFLSYEEQAIIKMYNFSSKEELKKKLKKGLDEIEEIYEKAAVLLKMPLDALKERIFCNFARIFN